MKKILLVLILIGLAAAVFPQSVSLDTRLSFYTNEVIPNIGVEIGIGSWDILAGIGFWITINDINIGAPANQLRTNYYIKAYAGIAPRVEKTEKFTLSFPLLLRFNHKGCKYYYINRHSYILPGDLEREGRNTFAFDLGARVCFALNQRWSVYAGLEITAIEYRARQKTIVYIDKGHNTTDFKGNSFGFEFFRNGSIDLGLKFSFRQ